VAPPASPVAQPAAQPPAEPVAPGALSTQEVIQRRDNFVKEVAGRYTLTQEQKDLMLTEPDKVIPQLAGRMIVDTFDMVVQTVFQQLPGIIHSMTQQQKASSSAEEAFFKRWPALQKPEHAAPVMRLAQAYRRLNPQMPLEQLIEEVGAAAHVALKVPYDQQPAQPSAPVPVAPNNVLPFTPAAPGGTPGHAAPLGPRNFWDELSQETQED